MLQLGLGGEKNLPTSVFHQQDFRDRSPLLRLAANNILLISCVAAEQIAIGIAPIKFGIVVCYSFKILSGLALHCAVSLLALFTFFNSPTAQISKF